MNRYCVELTGKCMGGKPVLEDVYTGKGHKIAYGLHTTVPDQFPLSMNKDYVTKCKLFH